MARHRRARDRTLLRDRVHMSAVGSHLASAWRLPAYPAGRRATRRARRAIGARATAAPPRALLVRLRRRVVRRPRRARSEVRYLSVTDARAREALPLWRPLLGAVSLSPTRVTVSYRWGRRRHARRNARAQTCGSAGPYLPVVKLSL